jgi:membrane-bound serine protease (ClpP class)
MTPLALAILLFAGGLVMLLAEVVLPSHGVLGLVGGVALVVGVGVCFWMNQYAGVAAAVTLVVLAPFAAALWVKLWPHTYAGKRLILGPGTEVATGHAPVAPVQVGQVGVVITELRPGGTCEFAGGGGGGTTRVEARSEHGIIPAGRRVEVVALVDHRPLVRAVS